jgi:Transposase
VLVIVDQPNTIGALPIAVARDCGCTVAYLPGLAMRKAADLYPGKSKTDARDAFIPARSGNKQLKNALFRSAWIASCHHPGSKAYYQKKREQGKKHNAAVICLARRRYDGIYSMLKLGTLYEENPALAAWRKA